MKKTYLLTSIILLLVILIFYNEVNPNHNFIYSEEQIMNSDTIRELIRYEPLPGKVLGIWPNEEIWASSEDLETLNKYFGFSSILIEPYVGQFKNVVAAGFNSSNVMALYWNPTSMQKLNGIGGIYADEADNNFYNKNLENYSPKSIKQGWDNINLMEPRPRFVIGTFKWGKQTNGSWDISDEFWIGYELYADNITYTDYHCRCGSQIDNNDQRQAWEEMKSKFTDKFSMVWIGAHKDTLDYAVLFDKAKELKINEIWLYQYEEKNEDYYNINQFCEVAYQKGWLKKIESTIIGN